MVNPFGHWILVLFGTISWIPLRGLSGSWGILFQVYLRGLSCFRVPSGLVVLATTVPANKEPTQRPQAQEAPQVISDIAAPNPEPIPAPPDTSTAPPSMIYRGSQGKVSSGIK